MKVESLVGRFAVSEVTIRKDLRELEHQGFIQRTYGGATFSNSIAVSLNGKLQSQADAKRAIAWAAIERIRDGETIILDAGSATCLLASLLVGRFSSLSIITNSISAAVELALTNYDLILVGGELQPSNLTLTGPTTERTFSGFYADRAFLGTSGTTLSHGHSASTTHDAEVKRAIIQSSAETYVLADSSKLGHPSLATYARLEEISLIITDSNVPARLLQHFLSPEVACEVVWPEAICLVSK
jgi:DeoR/GlpR family transcriptional regulator of sugar metabolism